MQEALDHWEAGLTATGGAIVPSKSFWYLVDYKWTQGTWTYHNPTFPTTLHVRDHNRQLHSLRRLSLDSAQRTLGVYLAPTGQDITQRDVLRAEGYGFVFRTSITGCRVHFVGYAFVDDADIGICKPDLSAQ